mgnify:CR=1 FL=1
MDKGSLYLVPAPLDFGTSESRPLTEVLPELSLQKAAGLQHWVTENAKTLRAFLKRVAITHPLSCPLQALQVQELPRSVQRMTATRPPGVSPARAPSVSADAESVSKIVHRHYLRQLAVIRDW